MMDARKIGNFPLLNVDNRRFDPRWWNSMVKLRTGFLLRWSFAWVPGSWDGKKHPNEIWGSQLFRTIHFAASDLKILPVLALSFLNESI